jgi:Ca-activated chloride channel family protein
MKAHIKLDHELLAVETEHRVHAMLELVAPEAHEGGERPPLELALVIDRSGSMGGPKLEFTKRCARYLVRRLAPQDRLTLVAYDDEVELLTPLVRVDEAPFDAAIAQLYARGTTNLSGGWLKGAEQLRAGSDNATKKILLLTDGLANVGVTDPAALVSLTGSQAETGVGTTTIGFGEDFDENLLTAMADAGRGNAHYVESPEAAPAIFAEEFEGLVSLVAQNVSIELRPSSEVAVVGVLNDYPAVGVGGGIQLQLGDAYGGERRRVVFELHIPELARLGVATVADVVIRYTSVGEEIAAHELTLPVKVNLVSASEAAAEGADQDVVEEVTILKSARAEEQARKMADGGEFDGAMDLLRTTADELRMTAPNSARAGELAAEAERLEEWHDAMSVGTWGAAQSKRTHFASFDIRRGRPSPYRRPPSEPPDSTGSEGAGDDDDS